MKGPETRKSLLLRLQGSSHCDAWEEFGLIYEPLVYRMARTRGLQHADAADVVQEVLSSVARAIGSFDPAVERGSFRGWLFKITRNAIVNSFQRRKGPQGTGDSATMQRLCQEPDPNSDALPDFELEYRKEIFQLATKRVRNVVSEDMWNAFWMVSIECLSYEDAARKLGKSPGAVRIARCRVLARLRDEVVNLER